MDAISRSVLDIYWGYLLDKILCKAGVSIHSWVCEGLAVWQYLGSFPSHSSHLSQQTISSGDNCHHPWLPLITSLPIIPDVMRWWEARERCERYYFLSWRMSSIQPDCCHHTFTDRDWLHSIRTSCWHDRTQQCQTSH